MRPTRLEINLSSIKANLNIVNRLTNNKEVMAVVKADGYGLGSVQVSKTLVSVGVNNFAVALVEEALTLKEQGIDKPILLFAPFHESEIPILVDHSITPTLCDYYMAKILNQYAYNQNMVVPVHVKIDTGMGRLGLKAEDAILFLKNLIEFKNLRVEGLYSHFPSADIPDLDFTHYQITHFTQIIQEYKKYYPNIKGHLANSGGIVCFPESHFDAVRPGLMLYGCYSSPYLQTQVKLNKVLSLKTRITHIKTIYPGESVSYGRTFIAKAKTKMAVLPVGYADGYSTLLSNKGEVLVQNKRLAVIGRVCMDYTMIDVTQLSNVGVGEEVTIIGDGITEEEMAKKCGLVPYEILTGISQRVPRIYIVS